MSAGSDEVDEHRLCGEVRLHGPVIIEVIATEARERADLELQSFDPTLLEAVRRNLHRNIADASVDKSTENALEFHRSGSRQALPPWKRSALAAHENA
jgi:hypothetical protein